MIAAALAALALAAAPADAAAAQRWIAANAHPIATADPVVQGHDLDALDAVVGPARIAAFGEATHGGREFFLMKHRAFRHLVEHDRFTAFAIEANYAEADALNAWIHGGPGDPEKLLSDVGFWTWDTEEVLDLIRWMRAYNAAHANRLSFYGFDIQYPPSSLAIATGYLAKADPAALALAKPFEPYLNLTSDISSGYKATHTFAPDQQRALIADAEALVRHFETNRDRLVAATGEPAYLRARAAAAAVVWYFIMQGPEADLRFRGFRQEYDVRDRAMADLARAALEMEGEGGRLFVWAHNAHVSQARAMDQRQTMGRYLKEDLGEGFVNVGFAFDHGSFQAYPPADPARPDIKPKLTEMRAGPAPADHSEAVLRTGPKPAYLVDLRKLSPGTPAYAWFAARRPLRWTGALYALDLMAKHPPISLTESYDALIFIDETTRARPTANSRAKLGLAKTW